MINFTGSGIDDNLYINVADNNVLREQKDKRNCAWDSEPFHMKLVLDKVAGGHNFPARTSDFPDQHRVVIYLPPTLLKLNN
jgi:hypothetical protein